MYGRAMIHTLKTGEKGYHNINDCGTLSKTIRKAWLLVC